MKTIKNIMYYTFMGMAIVTIIGLLMYEVHNNNQICKESESEMEFYASQAVESSDEFIDYLDENLDEMYELYNTIEEANN